MTAWVKAGTNEAAGTVLVYNYSIFFLTSL